MRRDSAIAMPTVSASGQFALRDRPLSMLHSVPSADAALKIDAVEIYRKIHGVGLKEAKEAVDAMRP